MNNNKDPLKNIYSNLLQEFDLILIKNIIFPKDENILTK